MKRHSSLIILIASMLTSGLLAILFGQDNNWDLRNYHIYNAFAFFEDRTALDILPAQLQSFFNPLPDVMLLRLIARLKPVMVGFSLGALHGVNYFLVFKIAELILGHLPEHSLTCSRFSVRVTPFRSALLIAAAALIAPSSISLLGTSYHDNLVSIPILASLWLILLFLNKKSKPSLNLILLSGVVAGMAFGLKMTALLYILASIFALVISIPGSSLKMKTFTAYIGGVIFGTLLVSGFWYWQMWQLYANPIFPWFNNIFKSPELLDQVIRDTRYLPKSLIEAFLYPIYFMYERYGLRCILLRHSHQK
ncbi:MAG: glycosyltransferase family 39 protein [Candidatus Marinimicrobia bacterium]|nr:glycosyltransferase family 39 protein [Candidatus Neomarinimicrobiota bacterium]